MTYNKIAHNVTQIAEKLKERILLYLDRIKLLFASVNHKLIVVSTKTVTL